MSNQHSSKDSKKAHTVHQWEKEERTLSDGFSYYYFICSSCHEVLYPAQEFQRINDYSKENLFLFVEDWALLLLYVGSDQTDFISGITHYMKMLFLALYELAPDEEIPSENPGFYAYKYGPYSRRIDHAIQFLVDEGYISINGKPKSSWKERFFITSKGVEKGLKLFNHLSKKQQEALRYLRGKWDEKHIRGLCKYVYAKYPDFVKESLILDDLFPGVKLNRRRG